MAEPMTGVEYVDAYDTTTGEKLGHQVPRSWVDGPNFPTLSLTPKQKAGDTPPPAPKPAPELPAKSASKAVWVKYATAEAHPSLQLSKDSAEAMSVDQLHDYYTTAQEG